MTLRKTVTLSYSALIIAAFAAAAFAQISPELPEPGWAPDGSPVKIHGQLKAGVSGSKGAILANNGSGSPVTLRGMSLFWSSGTPGRNYYNDAVVGHLVYDWNVSVVRAAIAAYNEKGGGGASGGYMEDTSATMTILRRVVNACIRRGIYVIVDWHTHNATGNVSSGNYYADATMPSGLSGKSVKTAAQEFFGKVAQEYNGYPNVLFEVYNEPCNDGAAKACQNESWSQIKTYADDVVATIRGKGNNNLVIVGNTGYSSNPNDANGASNKVTDAANNIAYTMHFYSGTHKSDYRTRMTTALGNGLAVFATEWGTTNANGDGGLNTGSGSESETWVKSMEDNNVSWANWSLVNLPEASAALSASGVTGGPWSLSTSGTWVRTQIHNKNNTAYSSLSRRDYNVNLTQPTSGGTISRTPSGSTLGYNTSFTITANPNPGWELMSWTGDALGNSATLNGKVTGFDISVGAEFYEGGLVKNGHFTHSAVQASDGTTAWSVAVSGGAADDIQHENGQASVNVTATGTVNLRQTVTLVANKQYRLRFKARTASGTRTMNVGAGAHLPQAENSVNLTTTMTQFERVFNSTSSAGSTPLSFLLGAQTGKVYFDDISLVELGASDASPARVILPQRTAWSMAKTIGGVTLVGPSEAGSKVTLYDVRGKAVKTMAAKSGMTIGGNLPAGNYFAVVKNAAGKEVMRDRVSLLK